VLAAAQSREAAEGLMGLYAESKSVTYFLVFSGVLALQLMEEAGQGLVALHQRGIVHRDIKPQNILLTDSRRAKVSDMGLCKRLAIDQSSFESWGPGAHMRMPPFCWLLAFASRALSICTLQQFHQKPPAYTSI
jgi:serine/threonine protein kinase